MTKRKRSQGRKASGCQAGPGTVVTFSYELYDAEGELVERSDPAEPLEAVFGYGQLAPPLEQALAGAVAGQACRIRLTAEEAFGRRDPGAVLEVEPSEVPAGVEPGDELSAETLEGENPLTLKVLEVTEDRVVLDANHPLCDQTVDLDVVVEGVRPALQEELKRAAELLEASALLPPARLLTRGKGRYEKPDQPERIAGLKTNRVA